MELREAYVLHARPWRDSSQLLELLVRDRGRVRAVARGVRGGSRRRPGNPCQLFAPLLVSLKGRSELKTLAQVEAHGPAFRLAGQSMFAGLYANEILVRALPEGDDAQCFFDPYQQLVRELSAEPAALEASLRQFERTLLSECGYGVDFFHDGVSGKPLQADVCYRFVAGTGLVPLAPGGGPAQAVYRGEVLLKVGAGELDDVHCRRAAKQVLRLALVELIGDKPLNSRQLIAGLRR